MPQMTAVDQETGKTIKFEWYGDEPPTDAELDEIAKESRGGSAPAADKATPERDWVDAIPSAMGLGFSLAGGSRAFPTGMALGALGGAAGEGFRQTIRAVQGRNDEVPETVLERIKAMGSEGLSQGAMEGLGRGAGAVITPVAKTLYGVAMRPDRYISRNVGGGNVLSGLKRIIDEGFTNRVFPTAAGADKAGRLVKESMGHADEIARAHTTPIPLDEVLKDAATDQATRMGTAQKTAGITPNWQGAADQLDTILTSHRQPGIVPRGAQPPVTISAEQLQAIRRGSEDVADPVFKAARQPGGPGYVTPGTQASVARSVAGASKARLERELGDVFKQTNRTTQARSGLREAANIAAARPNMMHNLLAGGAGMVSSGGDVQEGLMQGLKYRALSDPRVLAAAGFALPSAARYGVRGLDAATGGTIDEELKQAIQKFLAGNQPQE